MLHLSIERSYALYGSSLYFLYRAGLHIPDVRDCPDFSASTSEYLLKKNDKTKKKTNCK